MWTDEIRGVLEEQQFMTFNRIVMMLWIILLPQLSFPVGDHPSLGSNSGNFLLEDFDELLLLSCPHPLRPPD
jgi:hypothetical protein